MALHIHTQDRFNNITAHSLYRILVMATSLVGVMKMGNIVPKTGIDATPLAFQDIVLTITPSRLPDVTTLPTPTCLCCSLLEMSVLTTPLCCYYWCFIS